MTGASVSVTDTAGDSNDVYAYVRIYTALEESTKDVMNVRNSLGSGRTVTNSGMSWHASNNITGVRLIACVDDALGDTCYRGSFIDNPNT